MIFRRVILIYCSPRTIFVKLGRLIAVVHLVYFLMMQSKFYLGLTLDVGGFFHCESDALIQMFQLKCQWNQSFNRHC